MSSAERNKEQLTQARISCTHLLWASGTHPGTARHHSRSDHDRQARPTAPHLLALAQARLLGPVQHAGTLLPLLSSGCTAATAP